MTRHHSARASASSAPAGSRPSSPRRSRTCRTSPSAPSTDRDREAARCWPRRTAPACSTRSTTCVADPAVDVVVVATPPASHAAIATQALRSGRHVFCEKPLATTGDDLGELVARGGGRTRRARRRPRAPLQPAAGRRRPGCRTSSSAPPQRFLFENDASDEDLDDDHWFWDARLSGGIFVEHGVHFFDAAAMLLGRPATAVQATRGARAPAPVSPTWSARPSGTATTCSPRTPTPSRTRTAASAS